MKHTILVFTAFLLFPALKAQDIVERISNQICACLDTIENMDSLNAKLDRCLPEALEFVFNSEEDDDSDDTFTPSDTIEKTVTAVMEQIGIYCPKIKAFILSDEEAKYYKMSESEKANEYFSAGDKAFKDENYKEAVRQYAKAIREDDKFVYAYDDLGLTYRRMGDNKKAIKNLEKSLLIYPYGTYALQNLSSVYLEMKKYDESLDLLTKMINLYPANPEGYYGKARVFFLQGEYETALKYACYTHKMYLGSGSEFTKDTQSLITVIHDRMKEKNVLDKFSEITAQFGINFTE
jgi:tetratricopeptide (TPR) repeat protein